MKRKILVVAKTTNHFLNGLEQLEFEVQYMPEIGYDQLVTEIKNYHALVIRSHLQLNKHLLIKAEKLELIGRLGSGMDVIDSEYANLRGIELINSPEGNAVSVAEHALGTLLCLLNNIKKSSNEMSDFAFLRGKNKGEELLGKTIGIVGFGNTGTAFATRLQGFGVRILTYDKYKANYGGPFPFIEETMLGEVQKQADIISFHLPLNKETEYFVDGRFLEKCKRGVILINTSRGKIVDTRALLESIKSGWVKGACLDVFENEQPETYDEEERAMYKELFNCTNVICTPHIAGVTQEAEEKIAKVLLVKIARYITNRQL